MTPVFVHSSYHDLSSPIQVIFIKIAFLSLYRCGLNGKTNMSCYQTLVITEDTSVLKVKLVNCLALTDFTHVFYKIIINFRNLAMQ